MGHELNPTLKDLALRQNREVTPAQIDDYIKTKKYTSKDLDDYIKSPKNKAEILNSINPEKAIWDYEEHKLCQVLSGNNFQEKKEVSLISDRTELISSKIKSNDIRDITISTKTNKSTITEINLLDVKREQNPQRIKIKYPAGLLDEFIAEYKLIIMWLEANNYDVLLLQNSDNPIQISQHEFENAIKFLEKMKQVSEDI